MTSPSEKLRVQLRNVNRGYAEVWVVSDDHPDLADVGTVERFKLRGGDWKWIAYRSVGSRVGIHFATRKAAVNALTDLFVERLGRAGRRSYGLNLRDRLRSR